MQLLNGTKLHKKARDDVLLMDDYSFMNTEGYSFLHPEVKEIADFMRKECIQQADSINNQYNISQAHKPEGRKIQGADRALQRNRVRNIKGILLPSLRGKRHSLLPE